MELIFNQNWCLDMYKGALQGRIWNPVRQCKAGSQALARAKLELSEITLICARVGHRLSPPLPGPLLFESVARYCEKLYDIETWRLTSAEEKRLCINAGKTLISLADGSVAAGTEARQNMHSILCSLFGTANVTQVPATYADFDLLGGAFSGICKLKCSTKGGLTVVVQEAALLSTQFAAPKGMLAASPLLVVAGGNVAFGALIKLPVDDAHFTAAEIYQAVYCLSEHRSTTLESLACSLHAIRIFALACPKRAPRLWSDFAPWLTRICHTSPIERLSVGYDPHLQRFGWRADELFHRPESVCCCESALRQPSSAAVVSVQYERQLCLDYDDLGASELLFEARTVPTKSLPSIPITVRFSRRCPCAIAARALNEIGAVERLVGMELAGEYVMIIHERSVETHEPLTGTLMTDTDRDLVVDRLREFETQMTERGLVYGNLTPESILVGPAPDFPVKFKDLGYCAFDAGKRTYPPELCRVTGDRREPYELIKLGDDSVCFQRTIDWIYTYD